MKKNAIKLIATDVPPLFKIAAMETEAKTWDQAKAVLADAMAAADQRGISYDRLRFYIQCFGGQYGYCIVKKRMRRKN